MSGFIKIKAKELLLNNTIKLFLVSLVGFTLKLFSLVTVVLLTHFSLISDYLQSLVATYNSLAVYFIYSLIVVILYLATFLFISGIKLGESAIYFMQSKGSNAKFRYLFIFLRPSQSFRALYLYSKLFIYKFLWFLFFSAPPLFCSALTLFLFFNTSTYRIVFYTLIFGIVILTSISRFFYNCAINRYSYASFYLCTDLNIGVNDAIEKSRDNTDGFIKDSVFLKTSFLPWILCCIFIFPAFYVIPFIKLSKARFITFTEGLRKALPINALNQPIW